MSETQTQTDLSVIIATRIAERAEALGMTHRQLAQSAGVSRSALSEVLAQRSSPRISQLAKIALALKMPLEELVGAGRAQASNPRMAAADVMDAQAQLHDRVEKVSRQLRQAQSELREAKSSHESRLSMIRHAANAVLDDIRSRLRIPDGTTVFDGLKAHVEMTSAAEDALSDVDGDSLANKAHNLRDRYRRLMDAQAQLHDRVEKVSRQLRQAQSELREAKSSHESRLSMIRHALEVDADRPQLALMRAAMAIYEPLSDPDPL